MLKYYKFYLKFVEIVGLFAGVTLVSGMLGFCYYQTRPQKLPITSSLFYKGKVFYLETAVAPHELVRGLKFRDRLESDHGMLFKLDGHHKTVPFWMFQVHVPLQIIFLNGNYVTTVVPKASPCPRRPCQIYFGTEATQVLELPDGAIDVQVGDRLDLKSLSSNPKIDSENVDELTLS